jgi:hypothetical protein
MVLQVWIFCMRQVQVVPIGFAGTFVLFSALFVLGNYQNHDGDFGQYVIQARNLLLGRPWDHLVAGLPSVPPLYSMLLAALTWFGGVNAYAYAVLNSVLWAGTAVMAFHYFRNDFKSEVTAYGFLVAVLFSPFILYFQQSGVPNILYGAGAMLALLSAKRLSEGAFRLSYALCILLPALIRSEALALYAALFLYFGLKQQWRLLILPVLGVALLIGSDLLLSLNFDLRSNFRHAASTAEGASGGWDAGRLLSAYCYMFLSYFFGFADFLFAPGITAKQAIWSLPIGQFLFRVGPLAIVIASIFGAGVLIHRRYLSLDKLFFAAHLGLISMFLLVDGVPVRYLLALAPIYIFYVFFAVERIFVSLRLAPLAVPALTTLPFLIVYAVSIPRLMSAPARENSLFTPAMSSLADWIAQNSGGKPVAYYKTRLMTLLLDLRSDAAKQSPNVRSVQQAERLLSRGALVVIRKVPEARQLTILGTLQVNPNAAAVWEDDMHAVFAEKSFSPNHAKLP